MRFERPDRRESSTENARFTQMGSLVIFYIFIFVSERAACRVVGNMRKSRKKSIKVYCVCSVYLSWDCLGVSFIIFKWVCLCLSYNESLFCISIEDWSYQTGTLNQKSGIAAICCLFSCAVIFLSSLCVAFCCYLHSFMINTTYTHKLAEL